MTEMLDKKILVSVWKRLTAGYIEILALETQPGAWTAYMTTTAWKHTHRTEDIEEADHLITHGARLTEIEARGFFPALNDWKYNDEDA